MASNFSATTKSVAIVSKPGKPELAEIVPGLLDWFHQRQYRIVVDLETSPFAAGIDVLKRDDIASRSLNFVVVLGGDGTLLSAARAVAKSGIPIMGVNLGSLGFLTEVPLEDMYTTLQGIDENGGVVETRSMVHCDVIRDNTSIASYDAVNDLVVGKGTIARLNHCDVYIDKIFVSSYQADSLIVSTPTGSTAYSLAAGGPILMPSVEAFVITPVSAHSLTHRPLVVRDIAEIEIVAKTGSDEAYLSVDGQLKLQVKLFRTQGTFFDVLRAKLKWGQR